jgi:transcriptional regulator with XRE-family HTH domain
MSFGHTLQELRNRAGISQIELARRSDTSINTLRNWEQDRALPRIDAATRLARALGVSLDKLAVEDKPGSRSAEKTPNRSRKK